MNRTKLLTVIAAALALTLANARAAQQPAPIPTGSNVVSFANYKPDNTGKKLITDLFNKAIEDVARDPAKDTLVIPAGTYLLASGYLKSGVQLYLSKDAVLLGSKNMKDYQEETGDCVSAKRGIVVLKDCEDVRIFGPGTIDGNWQCGSKHNLMFVRAKKAVVEGIHSINHTSWDTLVYASDGVLIDGVTIRTHPQSGNTDDGIDIMASRAVEVRNCEIVVNDDGIVLKNKDPNLVPVDVRNIHIHDNVVTSKLVAALKIGTETTPGTWSNIVFENNRCLEGNLKVVVSDGAIVEDVTFRNNVFEKSDGRRGEESSDISITIKNRTYGCLGKWPGKGKVKSVLIENCQFLDVKDKYAGLIEGRSEENGIGTVTFRNVTYEGKLLASEKDLRQPKIGNVGKIVFDNKPAGK